MREQAISKAEFLAMETGVSAEMRGFAEFGRSATATRAP